MAGTTRHETNHRPERLTMSTTPLADALIGEYKTLRDRAGYGRFTGAGVDQIANHVVFTIDTYNDSDDLTRDMAIGVVAGFLAGSLANTFDVLDAATGIIDEHITFDGRHGRTVRR